MFSRKRIVFILALSVAVSASAVTMTTLTRKDRTAAAPPTMNVLQVEPDEQDKPTAAEVATLNAKANRKLRVSRFQRMPVTVTEVRNLQSETWYKDLQIEVKNVSDKPIYRIEAYLTFPDDYSDRSKISLLSLQFGLPKYRDISVVGNPLDPHLKPGKTCVLRLHEYYWDILRQREKRFPERLKSFVLGFGRFSFGDETGFTSENGWADYRGKKHKALHHRELSPPPSDPK